MNINNRSNNNFKGTFIFNTKKNQKIVTTVKDIIPVGKQIFHDIKKEGDLVIVTRDNFDNKIVDLIEKEKLSFEYYPEINTKCKLTEKYPEGLKQILKTKNNCIIENLDLLKKTLEFSTSLPKQIEYLQESINTLRLNIENLKININPKQMFIIRDNSKQRTIYSTGFKDGQSLIFIKPDSINADRKYILLSKNGKKIEKEFNTPKEMKEFRKIFSLKINNNNK